VYFQISLVICILYSQGSFHTAKVLRCTAEILMQLSE